MALDRREDSRRRVRGIPRLAYTMQNIWRGGKVRAEGLEDKQE